MPEIRFSPWAREWRISFHKLVGGHCEYTGIKLRSGWSFEFGPLLMFWETQQ